VGNHKHNALTEVDLALLVVATMARKLAHKVADQVLAETLVDATEPRVGAASAVVDNNTDVAATLRQLSLTA
jgi:hypothetical protein